MGLMIPFVRTSRVLLCSLVLQNPELEFRIFFSMFEENKSVNSSGNFLQLVLAETVGPTHYPWKSHRRLTKTIQPYETNLFIIVIASSRELISLKIFFE
jgi:hypothetical protein